MNDDIPFIVPSRGRPQNIGKLLDVWGENSTGVAKLIVVVDSDDPTRPDYLTYRDRVEDIVTLDWPEGGYPPYQRLVRILNYLAPMYAKEHFAVGFMGDDHRPRTRGWDREFLNALHDLGSGLVYGNDLHQMERLPTAPAITSDIIRTLGYYGPTTCIHLAIDMWWKLIMQNLECLRYLPEVIVEHMHPHAGKAAPDEGYIIVNRPEQYAVDQQAFDEWVFERMPEEIRKLKELMGR